MQGFYQIAAFAIPNDLSNQDSGNLVIVDFIVISRRSRDRAGLRYQRRGIDDDANVANFVETETIMRINVSYFRIDLSYKIRMSVLLCSKKGLSMSSVMSRFAARVSWLPDCPARFPSLTCCSTSVLVPIGL